MRSGQVRLTLANASRALSPESAGLSLDEGVGYPALYEHVRDWVSRMLVVRTFARAEPWQRRRSEETAA
jgi:hypothetical protein